MISGITKFKLDRAGVRKLMKSEEMMNCVKGYANEAAQSLGEGYAVDTRVGKSRVNAAVYPVSGKAKHDNFAHNSILKAVFGK